MVALAPILGWLLGPTGRIVMIGLAFVAWTVYQRDQAADKAREECRTEQLQKTLDEITRQRDAAQAALADAEKQQAVTDNEIAALEKERDAIIAESKTEPNCRLDDATRERLRNIR